MNPKMIDKVLREYLEDGVLAYSVNLHRRSIRTYITIIAEEI